MADRGAWRDALMRPWDGLMLALLGPPPPNPLPQGEGEGTLLWHGPLATQLQPRSNYAPLTTHL